MKKLSIILAFILVAMISCTKSKEVHPEIGDGNDEIVTVGMKDVHVEYTRTDHSDLSRVVFHYCPADANGNAQQFESVEMTKKETFFELTLNDLLSDTLYWYYYELFPNGGSATNTTQKTFRTQAYDAPDPPTPPTPPSGVPEGAINGLFTINENGGQVYFSQGNLQYQASTNTWRFAEHQWDFVGTQIPDVQGYVGGNVAGSSNHLIAETYNGWIDLFGWGTSGWNCSNYYYHPWDSVSNSSSLYGPPGEFDLTGFYSNSDWGVFNSIENGSNITNVWRSLTRFEWDYVVNLRQTVSGIRYAKVKMNSLNGILILPDNWNASVLSLNDTNNEEASFESNVITIEQVMALGNLYGAVFLPAAGERYGAYVGGAGFYGCYWSASCEGEEAAYMANFSIIHFYSAFYEPRESGCSVRLVQDAR